MPATTVIVPIYNGMASLRPFFASLCPALPEGSQVVLVDDASTEPVFDTVPDLPRAGSVERLRNRVNLGYSVAVNRGFAVATGDVVVQLNSDLVLQPNCITAMVDLIRREKDVGIVGSKLVYPTTGLVQHVGMAFGDHSNRFIYGELPTSHPLCRRTRRVQIMCGATVAMTRAVLNRLGPLDEGYFNVNNDLDHCMRAVHLGLRNFMCAESVAHHWESQSGPARFARLETGEARFWARWGSSYEMDLDCFVDEAIDHVLTSCPSLTSAPLEILDFSRGSDQAIVLACLERRWPGSGERIRSYRQMSNPASHLRLPMLVPHWVVGEPIPFIYLVDRYRELEENTLWFENRRQVVTEELVVDLSGAVLPTSQLGRCRPPG